MKEKHFRKICDIMAPKMQRGEQVMLASYANIGHVSAGRKLALATVTAIASGGTVSVHTKPRPTYIVVTNRQMVFLDTAVWGGPSKTVNGTVPLTSIAAHTEPKRGMATVVHLMIHGRDKALRVQFPRPSRLDGDAIISALRVPVVG